MKTINGKNTKFDAKMSQTYNITVVIAQVKDPLIRVSLDAVHFAQVPFNESSNDFTSNENLSGFE